MNATILIEAVKTYALANYTQGWDTVVECLADSDIAEMVEGCQTPQDAIEAVAREFSLEANRLTGYIVTTRDTDGTGRQSFATSDLAVAHFTEMAGKSPTRCTDELLLSGKTFEAVSDFGSVITLAYAA
ncbi:hypothetical protein [Rhodoferax antarcticus]|uniref:Uncharacterized protein n=1 Tax=Rhodoferax antarcticus ANT.BR TaxID=1111071 RepID=A0A1Q8Y9M8_9BURK|nr:hypothetical protein [Rhodoferax antarcticus]OLP04580.1 hypothetical protein BLL52_4124 [Rhodoferax antarcticus ANT.BR]